MLGVERGDLEEAGGLRQWQGTGLVLPVDSEVCRWESWAGLGTQGPPLGGTFYHTDDHVEGLPFLNGPAYGGSFTRAKGTGLEMWQLTRREAHVQDAEVVVSQAHPLTRCVIWPLRALVSSSAKWV